jgi:8-oxo-dGTP diphosphatase
MPQDDAFSHPIATVDAVIFTLEGSVLKVLLHRRPQAPFENAWALPGGFIHVDEDASAEAAVRRVLTQKAGAHGVHLEQLMTYSGRERDPRGWSISVAHLALVPRDRLAFAAGPDAQLFAVGTLPDLAFDHARIIADAVGRLRGKGSYSTLPASFLHDEFTLGEMQDAYEAVLGTRLDQSSFRRKVMALEILEDTGEKLRDGARRPASLYRLRDGVRTFDRTLGASGA